MPKPQAHIERRFLQPGGDRMLRAMLARCSDFDICTTPPTSASDVIEAVGGGPDVASSVLECFYWIRSAVLDVSEVSNPAEAQTSHAIASGLYFLAASRLISQTGEASTTPAANLHRVPAVAESEMVLCAVIANALVGGELRFVPTPERKGHQPEYVFRITVPACADGLVDNFERAVYCALCAHSEHVPSVAEGSGPLDSARRSELRSRINDVQRVKRGTLALVVNFSPGIEQASRQTINAYQVPVLMPSSGVTDIVLGMSEHDLLAEIRQLLELTVADDAPSHLPSTSGGTPVPGPTINIQSGGGPVSISTGAHSAAVAGSGNTVSLTTEQQSDLAALVPLIDALRDVIAEMPAGPRRDMMLEDVEQAKRAAASGPTQDAGKLKKALSAIKSAADLVTSGEKIISACNKIGQDAAPWIGLAGLLG